MGDPIAKEIFLSYGREPEVISFVSRLKKDLELEGFSVWLDQEDIPAGSDWHAAIGGGLDRCKALVAVITPKYVASRYCASELYVADGDQKFIFPVFHQDTDFSTSERARGVKYVISGINWTMFRPDVDNYSTSLQKLISGMRGSGLGKGGNGTVPVKIGFEDVDGLSTGVSSMEVSPHGADGQRRVPAYPHGVAPSTSMPAHQHGMPPPSTKVDPGRVSPSAIITPSAPPLANTPERPTSAPPAYGTLFSTPTQESQPVSSISPATSVTPSGMLLSPGQVSFFQMGMRLEAIDRKNPHMVCVATVAEVNSKTQELLIHFDGWSDRYDYWCEPTTTDIHPVGWAAHNRRELQPPKDVPQSQFNWFTYLSMMQAQAAPQHLFTEEQRRVVVSTPSDCSSQKTTPTRPSPIATTAVSTSAVKDFQPEMRLEAVDRKNPSLICVATVVDVQADKGLLIHFDGWSSTYDYWCNPKSADIHPAGWCEANDMSLTPPNGIPFTDWCSYLVQHNLKAAPIDAFTRQQCQGMTFPESSSSQFEVGMKLEARDRLYPHLIAVATINEVTNNKVLIHFDGWTSKFDYWADLNTEDIFPVGWCRQHGTVLQAPKGRDSALFSWEDYLRQERSHAVPSGAFPPHSETRIGCFQRGLRLEAVNQRNRSLVCVASISSVKEQNLRIHLDGRSDVDDFWCERTSCDIHPIGWSVKSQRVLQPPPDFPGTFTWQRYLRQMNARAAPDYLFTPTQCKPSKSLTFMAGMRLEAMDRKNPGLVCVATVQKVDDKNNLLIHFDGWTEKYDYWCEQNSPDIHPVGWCEMHGRALQQPKGTLAHSFSWQKYLEDTNAIAAPEELFQLHQIS